MYKVKDITIEPCDDGENEPYFAFRFFDLEDTNEGNGYFWTDAGDTIAQAKQNAIEAFGAEMAATIVWPE
jgi:hypothetical protein